MKLSQRFGWRLRSLFVQFLLLAFKRQLTQSIDRLTGAAGKGMRQIASFAATNGRLGFGHSGFSCSVKDGS